MAMRLTAGIDVLNGTADDDTFIGNDKTADAGDTIDGGAGNDTLKLYDTTTLPSSVTSVENVFFIDNTDTDQQSADLDVSGAVNKGFEQIWVQDANTGSSNDIIFGDLKDGQVAGLKGLINTQKATIGAAQGVTAQTIALDGVRGATETALVSIEATDAKDLTVDLAGDSKAAITGATTSVLETVTFTGDGSVFGTVTGSDLAIDASANTGGVQVKQNLAGDEASFLGGAGDDAVEFNFADLSENNSIDMGEGYDIASVQVVAATGTNLIDAEYDALNSIENAEEIKFNNSGSSADLTTIDASKLDVANIGVDEGAGYTVTNLTSDNLVKAYASAENTLVAERNDDGEYTDGGVVNLESTDDVSVAATVAANGTNDGTAGNVANFDTLNLSGEGNVAFDNASTNGFGATVNAADLEGDFAFTAGTEVEQITLGGGEDTLDYKADGASTYAKTDVITDFAAGDTIELAANSGDGDVTEFDASGAVSYEQALTQAAASDVDGAWFEFDGSTFVVQNADSTNPVTAEASTDVVIELAGVDLGLTTDSFSVAS